MWKALKPEAGVSAVSIVTSAHFKRPPRSAALNTSGFQIFLLSLLLLLLLLPPSAPHSAPGSPPRSPAPLYPNPPPLPTFLILLPILSLCILGEKSFKWKHQNINKIEVVLPSRWGINSFPFCLFQVVWKRLLSLNPFHNSSQNPKSLISQLIHWGAEYVATALSLTDFLTLLIFKVFSHLQLLSILYFAHQWYGKVLFDTTDWIELKPG